MYWQINLQSLKVHNKWSDGSCVGVYLTHSPHHTTNIPLTHNTQTANIICSSIVSTIKNLQHVDMMPNVYHFFGQLKHIFTNRNNRNRNQMELTCCWHSFTSKWTQIQRQIYLVIWSCHGILTHQKWLSHLETILCLKDQKDLILKISKMIQIWIYCINSQRKLWKLEQ